MKSGSRRIAELCTNHHHDNVIPEIMLRLQLKQELGEILTSVNSGDSQVSHVAKDMPPLPGTKVNSSFIKQREDSWQVHLQQISPFLVAGVGVWWSHTPSGFVFHGDTDPADPSDAFLLLHHRYHSVLDVENRRDACWKKVVDKRTLIPAHSIKLYDADGNKTGKLMYSDNTVTLECVSTDPQDTSDEVAFHDPVSTAPEAPVSSPDAPPMEQDGETSTASTSPPVEQEDGETSIANSAQVTACINLNPKELSEGLKTKVGNHIKRLLGSDDDLVKFDDLRFKLKEAQ